MHSVSMHREASKNHNNSLFYIHSQYDPKSFWKSFNSSSNPVARVINSLIDAVNGSVHLPRIIIMLLDIDILHAIAFYGFRASLVIGKVMGYLVNSITSIIEERREKMRKIKPGSIIGGEPAVVWVSLLSHPHYQKVLSLKRKYNEVLEETLTLHRLHYFLDIEGAVKQFEFDRNNCLTGSGKVSLWCFIDQHIKRFDRNEISLSPRKVVTEANQRQQQSNARYILPRPPPRN